MRCESQQPDLPVVLLTAWTHLESAVQLVKAGAADYIGKPWDNDKLLATVENLLELAETTRERQRLQEEQRRRRERLAEQYDLCGIVFASDAMERVVELACRVARADVRVLISGPNGAGKERIAQIVHANSALRSGPFVAVNCGAIPAELIEAELFGAEAGAYTGANARTHRPLRGGEWRHVVLGRNRRSAAGRTSQAAASARDRPVRNAGLEQDAHTRKFAS